MLPKTEASQFKTVALVTCSACEPVIHLHILVGCSGEKLPLCVCRFIRPKPSTIVRTVSLKKVVILQTCLVRP